MFLIERVVIFPSLGKLTTGQCGGSGLFEGNSAYTFTERYESDTKQQLSQLLFVDDISLVNFGENLQGLVNEFGECVYKYGVYSKNGMNFKISILIMKNIQCNKGCIRFKEQSHTQYCMGNIYNFNLKYAFM